MPRATPVRWDLFCSVIDNFGDAGVAWRLARALTAEHGCVVRLWIDRPERLAPLIGGESRVDEIDGITVRATGQWRAEVGLPDVIVEVLGCGVPAACLALLQASTAPPVWLILEYLTAEAWVDVAHGKPSPQPRTGIPRRFWFPGFTPRTGGLLRESALLRQRASWQADPAPRAALWNALHLPVPDGAMVVTLFCYPNAPVAALLDAWAADPRPLTCLVPAGVARAAIEGWLGHPLEQACARGALQLVPVPFLPQPAYDQLLWSADLNFVRGEDSFVRAQWAARPFVWNAYPQEHMVHGAKLAAFMDRYTAGLDAAAGAAFRAFSEIWNGLAPAADVAAAWPALRACAPALLAHAAVWCDSLATLPELASTLVSAAANEV